MDINDLIVNKEIYTLRDTAIIKAEELNDLIEQIMIQIKPKVVEKTNELFEQFVIYFKGYGFNLTSSQERVRTARNELYNISLVLNELSESTATFRFEIPRKSISHPIEIRLNKETENLMKWRNSFGNSFDPAMIFNGSYKNKINTIFSVEVVNELIDGLNENIEWYKTTLKNVDQLQFTYGIYDSETEFETFKEFFEDCI